MHVWRCHRRKPTRKTGVFCSTHDVANTTLNSVMKRVFGQINIVKVKLNNRMSAELVNAILNIRTGLKRDNIIKHVVIISEIPEAVTM